MRRVSILLIFTLAACGGSNGGTRDAAADAALPDGGRTTDAANPDAAVIEDAASVEDAASGEDAAVSEDAASAEDASTPTNCDPLAQNCPNGKCAVLLEAGAWRPVCVAAPAAARDDGDTCARNEAAGPGHDDCTAGAFCTFYSVLPPSLGGERRCRKHCYTNDDCDTASGDRCVDFGSGLTPNVGLCIPSCAPFGADCAAPLDCSELTADTGGVLFAYCRPTGATSNGSLCLPDDAEKDHCQAGSACIDDDFDGLATCAAVCDATHPCPDLMTCRSFPGAPAGICD